MTDPTRALTSVGQLPPGTPTAMAPAGSAGQTLFLGSKIGIHRCDNWHAAQPRWERLRHAPLGVVALAASPNFDIDRTVIAGGESGLHLSRDGGASWQAVALPPPQPLALTLAFSPDFADDGMIIAGTLEDGVLVSDDRGARWSRRNFGMLDASVYAIAFAPAFAADGAIYAAAESALYHSYNRALAWKATAFDESLAPVLCLAIANDGALYAGTESHGLHRSDDGGATWRQLPLPADTISAIAAARDGQLIAATHQGVFDSADGGATWRQRLDAPVLALCADAPGTLASVIEQGLWTQIGADVWRALETPPIRSVAGCALSQNFANDGGAYLFGLQEGVWKTDDGGASWRSLNEELPAIDVHALALAPDFPRTQRLAAASRDGVLISANGGETWRIAVEGHATHVCYAPTSGALAAAVLEAGVLFSPNGGADWRALPGPWENGERVLALALRDDGDLLLALGRDNAGGVRLWQGQSGNWRERHTIAAPPGSACSIWPAAAGARWFAAAHDTVYALDDGRVTALAAIETQDGAPAIVLGLCGVRDTLYACTRDRVVQSRDLQPWRTVHAFDAAAGLAFAVADARAVETPVAAVLIGGVFLRGTATG